MTLENLNKLVQERTTLYKDHPDEAVAAYNREVESTRAYNGRQILELLQNADDAGAATLKISREEGIIRFYNDGEPFSYEGVKSLMIANLSNKVTSSFIGNKGLGFRAILNWASKVTIYSAGLTISFSKKFAEEKARELLTDLDKIRKERNLSHDCFPFPVLGIPEFDNRIGFDCNEEKGCCIEIEYDPRDQDTVGNSIEKQLEQINGTVLLFLNHISTIVMPGEHTYSVTRKNSRATIGPQTWDIYELKDKLPEEFQDKNKNDTKHYSVKIALPVEGETGDEVLFNYLPTRERVRLPFLLHATVELESSRNHINDSEVNRFILNRAADLIEEVAKKTLTPGQPSWRAFLLMTPLESSSSTVIEEALYAVLRKKRDSIQLFPTVSEGYCKFDEYSFFNNQDSEFWQELHPVPLCRLLQSVPSSVCRFIEPRVPDFQKYCDEINSFSSKSSMDEKTRAGFIVHLLKVFKEFYPGQEARLFLLTDDQGQIIRDASVFTPKKGDRDYQLPDFVSLSFMHEKLYAELIGSLKTEIAESRLGDESDARCLSRILKRITPVSDYDKTDISANLVKQVNQLLQESPDEYERNIGYVKAMVSTLIEMKGEAYLANVRLINQNGVIVEASELLLDTEYNQWIFGDVFGDVKEHFVQGKAFWNYKGEDADFMAFMRLLGVNAWTKEVKGCDDENYYHYLVRNGGWENQDVTFYYFSDRTKNVKYTKILHTEWLRDLSFMQIVLLLAKEKDLAYGLEEEVEWKFELKWNLRDWSTRFNYVRYQLTALPALTNVIFGKNLVLSGNFSRQDLYRFQVQDDSIDGFLELLRTDVLQLKDNELMEIVNSCEQKELPHASVRGLYDLLLHSRGNRLPPAGSLRLLCKDGRYHDREEVYYTNNTCLPEIVTKEMGLFQLDYPSRQGAVKVCGFFGIKSPDQIKIRMAVPEESDLSVPFSREFERIKPYLLLYALYTGRNVSDDDTKKQYATELRKCSIHLLVSGSFYVQSGPEKEFVQDSCPKALGFAEFVGIGSDYYVCIGDENSFDALKRKAPFCNAFAEIVGMALKLETRNDDFIYLLKDDQFKMELDSTRFNKEDLKDCFELMGLSREERLFWSNTLKQLGIDVDSAISREELEMQVLKSFPQIGDLSKKADYYRWNTDVSFQLLRIVEEQLGEEKMTLLLEECNISLHDWYAEKYRQLRTSMMTRFEAALWNHCNMNVEMQKDYLQLLFDYEGLTLKEGTHCQSLHFNVEEELNRDIHDKFGIELENISTESHPNLYPDLAVDSKEWPLIIRSLLYFEGNKDIITEYTDSAKQEQKAKEKETEKETVPDIQVINVEPETLKERVSKSGTTKRTKPVVHTKKEDDKKLRMGKEAEELVKQYFVKKGIDYRWRSSYADDPKFIDDAIGYDFNYEGDEGWRYLEVKASSDNSFNLSENEFRFATEKDNLNLYDIALVHGHSIRILKSFFTGKYTKSEKDYYISFGIQRI